MLWVRSQPAILVSKAATRTIWSVLFWRSRGIRLMFMMPLHGKVNSTGQRQIQRPVHVGLCTQSLPVC